MAHSAITSAHHDYFVPQPMPWPIFGATALFCMALGTALVVNGVSPGWISIGVGFLILLYMLVRWFGDVIRESEGGKYGSWEDSSFRWGMSWFIFSEVMFFGAFFGALFFERVLSVPDLASVTSHAYVWPGYTGHWPTAGPGLKAAFTPMAAWGIAAINTLVLLSSGVTVTVAHWALKEGKRAKLNMFLLFTIMLGFTFIGLQAHEYWEAYHDLNLKLTSGVYGSTFFLLTGFHGFHVTLGAIMLSVILGRSLKGHFKPEHHFAFEAVAWYWHFVDVVWLCLFVFVYWL